MYSEVFSNSRMSGEKIDISLSHVLKTCEFTDIAEEGQRRLIRIWAKAF